MDLETQTEAPIFIVTNLKLQDEEVRTCTVNEKADISMVVLISAVFLTRSFTLAITLAIIHLFVKFNLPRHRELQE